MFLRAGYLLIAIPLDEKAGDSPSVIDLAKAVEIDLYAIFSAVRKDGFFHMDTMKLHRKIGSDSGPIPKETLVPAVHPNTGVGVFATFKPSQLDIDTGLRVWAPEKWQLDVLDKTVVWSQKATHDLLGRPFGGKMPYAEIRDFM